VTGEAGVTGAAALTGAAVVVEALSRELPASRLVVDSDVLAAMSHDDAEWAPAGAPAAGVRVRSEAEVRHVVRICAALGFRSCPAAPARGYLAALTPSAAASCSTFPS
jgi:FAD/FMN-containing dehydrogenase